MSPDKKWRWVRHIDNALVSVPIIGYSSPWDVYYIFGPQVINTGDTLEMLSGGFYKGTIHRVVQPPADQRGVPRLGAYYFAMTDDDVRILPFAESPVLKRVGIERKIEDKDAPTMGEWRKGRYVTYGLTKTTRKDNGMEEHMVNGIAVKHYN